MRSLWRLGLVASAYPYPVHLDAQGDWVRVVGRVFWWSAENINREAK